MSTLEGAKVSPDSGEVGHKNLCKNLTRDSNLVEKTKELAASEEEPLILFDLNMQPLIEFSNKAVVYHEATDGAIAIPIEQVNIPVSPDVDLLKRALLEYFRRLHLGSQAEGPPTLLGETVGVSVTPGQSDSFISACLSCPHIDIDHGWIRGVTPRPRIAKGLLDYISLVDSCRVETTC